MSENAKTFYVSKEGDESIPQYNFSVDVVEQTVDLRNFTIESTNPLGDDEMDEVGSLSQSAEALRITASAPTRSTSIGADYDG